MECADIRRNFLAGRVPSGPEAEAHLQTCLACADLLSQDGGLGRHLAAALPEPLPEPNPAELFQLLGREVERETGLRAKLRAWPTRAKVVALLALALALFGYEFAWRPRADYAQLSPLVFWGSAGILTVVLGLGSARLLRGSSAPLRVADSARWLVLSLWILPALLALLIPLGESSAVAKAAFASPLACFAYGGVLSGTLVVASWAFERRDRVPLTARLTVGGLAGILANLLLEAHCASAHPGHLLLGHATIGVAWALLLVALAKPLARSS